jgi:hypothetical protein
VLPADTMPMTATGVTVVGSTLWHNGFTSSARMSSRQVRWAIESLVNNS